MMPYLTPAQISSVEEKLTGKNHSAMYFAGNALVSSIVGAISGNLIYEYLKNVFIAKGKGFVWAEASNGYTAPQVAYNALFGVHGTEEQVASSVFNFGNIIVPFIVAATCILGFVLAFKLPRDFTHDILVEEFVKMDPTIDTSVIEKEETVEERGEIIFVQIGLTILSGFMFGFIWSAFLMRSLKSFNSRFKMLIPYVLSCIVPFAAIYFNLKLRKIIIDEANSRGVKVKISRVVLILTSLVAPILPINIISLAVLQNGINKVYAAKGI